MHTLPRPGGLLDQDHMFVLLLDWVREAKEIREDLQIKEAQAKRHHSRG